MADDKTRVIPRKDAAPAAPPTADPKVVDGQIVFFCPAGHRLVVPLALAGKHGKCSKCSVPLQIPDLGAAAEPVVVVAGRAPESPPPAEPVASPEPAAEEGDWNFISGIGHPATGSAPALEAAAWQPPVTAGPMVTGVESNPMAMLLTRLWEERDHGGIVELHLVGGAVLLPEEFSPRWSGGTHGLFASQAADGSVTLTAVAWDTVQRIVVRQLTAVPDDMFD
jgi:hypothetical protein